MAAGANDMFTKVGSPGNATFLAAPGHTIGGTSFTVDSTSLWPTDTAVIFGIDTTSLVSGVATRDTGSYTVWRGIVASGTTITNGTLMYGTDQDYTAGTTTRVYVLPTSSRENRTVDGLLIEHNQDGTHDEAIITSRTADTTPASGDLILTSDISASNALKKATIGQILGSNPTSIGAAWASWTPTWTNLTVSGSTVVAKYIQIGKTVFFRVSVVLGSGNAPTGGVTLTLPVTAASTYEFDAANGEYVGEAHYLDTSNAAYGGTVRVQSSTIAKTNVWNSGSTYTTGNEVSSSVPFTWGDGDKFFLKGTYEAA